MVALQPKGADGPLQVPFMWWLAHRKQSTKAQTKALMARILKALLAGP